MPGRRWAAGGRASPPWSWRILGPVAPTPAGVQRGAGPAPQRPGDARAAGAGRVGGPHRRVAPRIRRARTLPVRAHPVPAAGHPLRGHQGPSRDRHSAPATRGARHRAGRRPERRQRRAAAAMGIDGGAGPAVQLPGRRPSPPPRTRSASRSPASSGRPRRSSGNSSASSRPGCRRRARVPGGPGGHRAGGSPAHAAAPASPAGARPETLGTWLDSAKYVGFEDSFRGSTDEIRSRVHDYLPLFEGATDVLDIGCGRGEFLEVLGDLRHQGTRRGHQPRDGGALPDARTRRRRRRRRPLPRRRCRTPRWAACSRSRSSSTSRRINSSTCSNSPTTSCGPARASRSRRSTLRAGTRSSRPTSATSPTCTRSTPTRSATC